MGSFALLAGRLRDQRGYLGTLLPQPSFHADTSFTRIASIAFVCSVLLRPRLPSHVGRRDHTLWLAKMPDDPIDLESFLQTDLSQYSDAFWRSLGDTDWQAIRQLAWQREPPAATNEQLGPEASSDSLASPLDDSEGADTLTPPEDPGQ